METKIKKDEKEKTSSGKNHLNLSIIRFKDYLSRMLETRTKRASPLAPVSTASLAKSLVLQAGDAVFTSE